MSVTAIQRRQRIDVFKASGTWVCPGGVNYAIAVLVGGGGGGGGCGTSGSSGSAGGASTALGGTAIGGNGGGNAVAPTTNATTGAAGPANSGIAGRGGITSAQTSNGPFVNSAGGDGTDGARVTFGTAVVSGTSYTITVGDSGGAGGATGASGGSGGSGLVEIWYER